MADKDKIWVELFIQGQSPNATDAMAMVRRLCQLHFGDGFRLDVVDIFQQPERGREVGLKATPTLIRRHPEPMLRTVGPLTEARVARVLGLRAATR